MSDELSPHFFKEGRFGRNGNPRLWIWWIGLDWFQMDDVPAIILLFYPNEIIWTLNNHPRYRRNVQVIRYN